MKTFSGFPAGRVPSVSLPELLFTELIQEIDDLAELKVTLHVLWRLSSHQGSIRYVRRSELEADRLLLAGLGQRPSRALARALCRSVTRGVLLVAEDKAANDGEELFFANTAKGRSAVAALERGDWPEEVELAQQPNVFALYEQNIGVLTPMIADELRDAEETYPAAWIDEAFREAVSLNKRSWRYIRAILERWHAEGKDARTYGTDSEARRLRYL